MMPPVAMPGQAEVSAILTEKFGSFQGEGPLTGQRCAFVRFSRCNLRCSWCDTPESWDWTRFQQDQVSYRATVSELAHWVEQENVDLVVITGGEPLLQPRAMAALVSALPSHVRVQVETNGTQSPSPALAEVDMWVVSPKLSNSGMPYSRRIKPAALASLMATGNAVFKFVITDHTRDFSEIDALVEKYGLDPVWVMPEATTAEAVQAGTAALAEPALARRWNLSTRLHLLTGAR